MSNNNRNNNTNRRRGRGNNRSQGGGGQVNRVDSRARGNAPQLLEKYKKLAHDAALNGDRVQAEYYLQFADHYFRVLADSRVAKDDPRGPRRDADRDGGEEQDYFDEEFDRGQRQDTRRRDEPVADETVSEDRATEGRSAEDRDTEDRDRARRSGEGSDRDSSDYETAENPFTRPARAAKPRRPRRERSEAEDDGIGNRIDPAALPGAIGRSEEPADEPEDAHEEEAPAPAPASRRGLKPRTRSRRSNDDEELEAVG
ncbi:MAG: DUF4167 domain-containing protein [Candidatus Andeanibacterium colombiense]|uniref:DUF4167 domain-containing protein n=1 Tax=Candidatus Andeanibacterium colombiense TaxID=3121345 RepID=A0AAJ6BN87_9SPHN|nr:MAG: DUF4167 domain-containing protein [Sphingomonadaceae bacterium]